MGLLDAMFGDAVDLGAVVPTGPVGTRRRAGWRMTEREIAKKTAGIKAPVGGVAGKAFQKGPPGLWRPPAAAGKAFQKPVGGLWRPPAAAGGLPGAGAAPIKKPTVLVKKPSRGLLGALFEADEEFELGAPVGDEFGVSPQHVPSGWTWVGPDIWQGLPAAFVLHKDKKPLLNRIAFPAVNYDPLVDPSFYFSQAKWKDIATFAPFGPSPNSAVGPMMFVLPVGPQWSTDGRATEDLTWRPEVYGNPDDCQWEDKPPGWYGGQYGPSKYGATWNYLSFVAPQIAPEAWSWLKMPSDFWRLDLGPGSVSGMRWWGYLVDLSSYVAAGLLPDEARAGETADVFWKRYFSTAKLGEVSLAERQAADGQIVPVPLSYFWPFGVQSREKPGTGALTVYLPEDLPAGVVKTGGAAVGAPPKGGFPPPPPEQPPPEQPPPEQPPPEQPPPEQPPPEQPPPEQPPPQYYAPPPPPPPPPEYYPQPPAEEAAPPGYYWSDEPPPPPEYYPQPPAEEAAPPGYYWSDEPPPPPEYYPKPPAEEAAPPGYEWVEEPARTAPAGEWTEEW